MRVLLRAVVSLDPYTFTDDLAREIAGNNDNDERSTEQVLLSTIGSLPDEKLTGFAIRLALLGHTAIPREGETDSLTEADLAFAPSPSCETAPAKPKAAVQRKAKGKAIQGVSNYKPKSKKPIAA